MLRFYQEYSTDPAKVPQAVAQLEITDLKQTPRSHKGWSTFKFPRLKGRGLIEATLSQVEYLVGFHRFDIFIC